MLVHESRNPLGGRVGEVWDEGEHEGEERRRKYNRVVFGEYERERAEKGCWCINRVRCREADRVTLAISKNMIPISERS